MRILLVGPIPPEKGGGSVGGVASHVWALAVQLQKLGHVVGIVADNRITSASSSENFEGIEVFGFGSTRVSIFRLLRINPIDLFRLRHVYPHMGKLSHWKHTIHHFITYTFAIRKFRPDIIHVHHLETRYPFAWYASNGEIPITATIHSLSILNLQRHSEYRNLVEKNLKIARALLFGSQYMQEEYQKAFPASRERCQFHVIYHPVDSRIYHRIPKEIALSKINEAGDRKIVLYLGRINRSKNINILVQAAEILSKSRQDFKVIFAGDGPDREDLIQGISLAGLEEMVEVKGFVPAELVTSYYSAADVFVNPSPSEAYGLVFLEAMLCGCPAIGCAQSFEEAIHNIDFACLIPAGDPQALANAINLYLDRDWDRQAIRNYALQFGWENHIHQYEEYYKEVILDFERGRNVL